MKTYDQFTTDLRPTVKTYEEIRKTENADPLKIQGFEGLRRVMNCRGCFPDDEVAGLKTSVFAQFVGHTSLLLICLFIGTAPVISAGAVSVFFDF